MKFAILDCFTDEPSGLGVPPYIGTYPRYIAGAILESGNEIFYFTIDDFRLHFKYNNEIKNSPKTNIKIKNLTPNHPNITQILTEIDALIVISGVQTPGKYLSALPGTVSEIETLTKDIKCMKILTGPAASAGEGLYGGGKARVDFSFFDLVIPDIEFKFNELLKNNFTTDIKTETSYNKIKKKSLLGAVIVKQHPDYPNTIAEIETAKGCQKKVGCSFCTEPIKNRFQRRHVQDIIEEVKALNSLGIKHFRLGKQSDFFDRNKDEIETILKTIRNECEIKTLHIDNADPVSVTEEKVKLIVKYCTEGNVAALGIESFDPEVIKANYLHSTPKISLKAIKIINKHGAEPGPNGLPKFLPGINILFGLKNESKKTHEHNMHYLNQILKKDLLLRRINIRQVVAFPGTKLYTDCGDKFIKKNKKYYWKWRNEIRQNIDNPMLKQLLPINTILKDVRMEIHDGNTTFGRQLGTYPLIIGIKQKLELNKFYTVRVTAHMLRSITAEVITKQ